ncbi:MAG: NUDIX hydrolase [Oligoflexales bacterium]
MKWEVKSKEVVLDTIPFQVEKLYLSKDQEEIPEPYHRLLAPDWVNVLAITTDGQAVLIRQYRAGVHDYCLETPGGCVDKNDAGAFKQAACRELEEETGYRVGIENLELLGAVSPNPAIQDNRIHFYMAQNVYLPKKRVHFPDENEDIEVVLMPLEELYQSIVNGRMQHGLCTLCVFMGIERLFPRGKFFKKQSI